MKHIAIQKLTRIEQLRELIAVFSLAFESEYNTSDTYLASMIKNSACIILAAIVDERVIGGLVAFEMTPIHGAKEWYVYDIAVHPEFQKQGIGARLITELKQEASERGVSTVFVEAESEDTGAVAFYRGIGGEEVAVNHFNFKV